MSLNETYLKHKWSNRLAKHNVVFKIMERGYKYYIVLCKAYTVSLLLGIKIQVLLSEQYLTETSIKVLILILKWQIPNYFTVNVHWFPDFICNETIIIRWKHIRYKLSQIILLVTVLLDPLRPLLRLSCIPAGWCHNFFVSMIPGGYQPFPSLYI